VKTELDDREKALAVRFALSVNDGEAEALAVASVRNLPIFSDDTAAIRVASCERLRRETTLDMMLAWSSTADPSMVTQALLDLARLANYIPSRRHPLRAWFDRGV
jgi:predicted nucleic acid-binding protein